MVICKSQFQSHFLCNLLQGQLSASKVHSNSRCSSSLSFEICSQANLAHFELFHLFAKLLNFFHLDGPLFAPPSPPPLITILRKVVLPNEKRLFSFCSANSMKTPSALGSLIWNLRDKQEILLAVAQTLLISRYGAQMCAHFSKWASKANGPQK